MNGSLYVAASGAIAHGYRFEVISNNVANINSSGFKRDIPVFESILKDITGQDVFVNIKGTATDFSNGAILYTGNPLDVSIDGKGFFVIDTPFGTAYTRKGNFMLSADGRLVTQDGYQVFGSGGPITIEGNMDITIDFKGEISATNRHFISSKVDTLRVVNFAEPFALEKVGGGLFIQPEGITNQEIEPNIIVKQGYLESTNVNGVSELVEMIDAMRNYEAYQKLIQSIDSINAKAVEDIAKV